MQEFRNYLQQELLRRTAKNPAYSLRAFAKHLGVNHATLSSLMSGKRRLTEANVQRLAKALNLSPKELSNYISVNETGENNAQYYLIQQDAFAAISEWYFDAILEMALIPNFKMEPEIISQSIGITEMQAKIALETLQRLELLVRNKKGELKIQHQNSSNILDPDFTTAAQKKYQKSVLEKSMEALETVDRSQRDHTSTTMAIQLKDLPKAKELIKKFRYNLNAFLQRVGSSPDEVYQLQVSFFPLTKKTKNERGTK